MIQIKRTIKQYLARGCFGCCYTEQPRVEFDTPLFQYTGPEQPRVN